MSLRLVYLQALQYLMAAFCTFCTILHLPGSGTVLEDLLMLFRACAECVITRQGLRWTLPCTP